MTDAGRSPESPIRPWRDRVDRDSAGICRGTRAKRSSQPGRSPRFRGRRCSRAGRWGLTPWHRCHLWLTPGTGSQIRSERSCPPGGRPPRRTRGCRRGRGRSSSSWARNPRDVEFGDRHRRGDPADLVRPPLREAEVRFRAGSDPARLATWWESDCEIVPSGVILPIALAAPSVNQTFPSDPTVIPLGELDPDGGGNEVTFPSTVLRPTPSPSPNQRFPSGLATIVPVEGALAGSSNSLTAPSPVTSPRKRWSDSHRSATNQRFPSGPATRASARVDPANS